jgi:hypothetical protein
VPEGALHSLRSVLSCATAVLRMPHRFSESSGRGLRAQVESLKSLSEGKPKYACGLTDGSDSISAILATQVRPLQF